MSNDLVERLRKYQWGANSIMAEAADRIEELERDGDEALQDNTDLFLQGAKALRGQTAAVWRAEQLEMALSSASSWLERWAQHVGNCRGGHVCTCGLTGVRAEVEVTLIGSEDCA